MFCRRISLSLAVALAAPAVLAQSAVQDTRRYEIPAGPLDSALLRFVHESGLLVAATPELLQGRATPGLNGSFSPAAGLSALLAGSGLQAERTGDGQYRVQPLPQDGTVTLDSISVVDSGPRDVTSEGSNSYAARGATLFKNAASLREIPQSVSVITRRRMDDRNMNSLVDVLSDAPGISKSVAGQGSVAFLSRGFAINTMQVDGVVKGSNGGSHSEYQADMAMYDRVEVLRGAAGLLQGNGQPGGTVNLVRKRPLAEKQISLGLHAGSWDDYRADIDATGPLNEAGTLRGRVVASWTDQHYFYDRSRSREPFFYGVAEYDLTPHTVLMAGMRYQERKRDGAYWGGGLPVSDDGSDLGLPRSTSFGASWARAQSNVREFFGEIKHDFNERWSLRIAGGYQGTDMLDDGLTLDGRVDPATMTGAWWVAYPYHGKTDTNSVDASLSGNFDLLGREHNMVLGFNYVDETTRTRQAYDYAGRQPFDWNDRYQSNIPRPDVARTDGVLFNRSQGVYGTLRLQLADPLKLVLGGRLSWYNYRYDNNHGTSVTSYKQSSEFTPYAGLLYDLTPQWTAYASYADIFAPQSNYYTAGGQPLDPAIGSNYEAGIKGELLDGRVNTSLAVFYIRQNDRAQVDPFYASNCPGSPTAGACYVNAGKVESKGIEAEISGEVAHGLQLWASYTFNRQTYLRDSANEGNNFSAVTPKHLFRAGASYRLPGDWSRLTLGAGVSAQSFTAVTEGNIRREQRGYAIWNAFARYQVNKQMSVALNIENLFDKVYYLSPSRDRYGTPRSVLLSTRLTF